MAGDKGSNNVVDIACKPNQKNSISEFVVLMNDSPC
jgi:hypothetical protein